jgi:hypothetical protein
MTRTFLKNLYQNKNRLFYLIYEFNILPARFIHDSWISELAEWGVDKRLFHTLRDGSRAEVRLSRLILMKRGVHQDYFFDFQEPPKRLALLDGNTLQKLLFYTGLTLSARSISREIERTKVAALKKVLGEPAYLFAMKKAPLLIGSQDFTDVTLGEPEALPSILSERGTHCLKSCFGEAPPSLTQRMLLKLPRKFSTYWTTEETLSQEISAGAWSILKRVLLQEVNPQWRPFLS